MAANAFWGDSEDFIYKKNSYLKQLYNTDKGGLLWK
jgi:hypothetical protein